MSAAPPTIVSAKVVIDIWSDVMCPWCAIGLAQLDKALAQLAGEVAPTIRFHPFELNPDLPEEGEAQSAHILRKFGRTAEQFAGMHDSLKQTGARAGFSLEYTGQGDPPPMMIWNTRLAHRLLTWTLRDHPALQAPLKRALLAAHFQARRNVSDPQVLADIAQAIGLSRFTALSAMIDPQIDSMVTAGQHQGLDLNITGVPAMLINGKLIVPGSQEPGVYVSLIRKVLAKEAAGLA